MSLIAAENLRPISDPGAYLEGGSVPGLEIESTNCGGML
jgi:hypothetical protein